MRLKNVQHTFFFLLLILTTLAFLGLIQEFLQPLFWSAVLAVIFHPVYQRWLSALNNRASLSALLTILSIVFIVILPLCLVGVAVTQEATALYLRVATGEIDLQAVVRYLEQSLPLVRDYLDQFGISPGQIEQDLSEAAITASRFLASKLLTIGQNTLTFTALLFLMLYVLFFFLRDGAQIMDTVIRVLPLGEARERRLFQRFAEVSRATIKGTLVVGLVQGTLGGVLFWVLGIGAPVLWGVIMTLLSLLPAIGSALVWGPAAIILLVSGEVVKGIILLAAGTLVIGLADNLLRPVLVGRDTRMPDFLILLSTLGGITLFGLSGFVIGPIIAAVFLSVWAMFEEEYARDTDLEALVEEAAPAEVPPAPDEAKAEVGVERQEH